MFSTLRNRFGIPGVISVIALVFAMFGGAYAASNTSSGPKATASAKAKQGPRGKTGKTGPAGPAGPAGPGGPVGAKGDAGANGANGAPGAPGTNGLSVTSEEFAGEEGPCEEGGSEFTSASPEPTYACNGEEGPEGPEGNPWTLGGTLPSGATLTGIWGTHINSSPESFQPEGPEVFTISFPIPLASPPERVFVGPDQDKTAQGCPGVVGADEKAVPSKGGIPTADPGKLCVYADQLVNAERDGFYFSVSGTAGYIEGASETGALFNVHCEAECAASGTWAVTAP
jgi:hypothetical protein